MRGSGIDVTHTSSPRTDVVGRAWRPMRWLALAATITVWSLVAAGPARAEFGIKTWEAGTCKTDTPECLYSSPSIQFYTQAAGHPPFGITAFEVNTTGLG